jgi:hypothetical protein
MLHLFLGENESDTRIEARKFAKDFASKNKEIVFDEPENVSSWDEVIFSKSLFGGGTLTFFDINQKDLAKDFLENKERFESSENFFVFSAKDSLVKADGLKSGKNFVLHNVKGGVKRELFFAGDATYKYEQVWSAEVPGISIDRSFARDTLGKIQRFCLEHAACYLPSHDQNSIERFFFAHQPVRATG